MAGNDLLAARPEPSGNRPTTRRGFGMTSTLAKLSTLRAPSGAGGLLALVVLLLACVSLAQAQNTPPPMAPEAVRESPLAVIYLKDKDGNLVRAPAGMTFEDFERLHRL